MNLIDMHCDTLTRLLEEKKGQNLENTDCCISIPEMKKAGTMAQFFACFTCLGDFMETDGYEGCYRQALHMISLMEEQLSQFPDVLARGRSYDEIMENASKGKISAVLTIEEGGILNGKMERLDALYERGVRLMTLMWNYENCLGFPNSRDKEIMEKGLKDFGTEVVKHMGELGMIVDVSHASDGSFRDILEYARGPVVASHSNCRALCGHPRNLSDDMIRALAEKGGIAGLNFCEVFLGTGQNPGLEEMTAHILHMIRVGGREFPAIGTDFDGFDLMAYMDIQGAGGMEKLWEALRKKGLSEDQLDLVWSGNALRILKMLEK